MANRLHDLKSVFTNLADEILEQTKFLSEIGQNLNKFSVRIDGQPAVFENTFESLQQIYDEMKYGVENSQFLNENLSVAESSVETTNNEKNDLNGYQVLPPVSVESSRKHRYANFSSASENDEDCVEEKRRRQDPPTVAQVFLAICKEAENLLPKQEPGETRRNYLLKRSVTCEICKFQVLHQMIIYHLMNHGDCDDDLKKIRRCPLCGETKGGGYMGVSCHVMWKHFGIDVYVTPETAEK